MTTDVEPRAGGRVLAVPALCLVVLVGASGSGKSTLARRLFRDTEVVSSDRCRALVADDENDQAATPDAFDLLNHLVGIRLRRGLLTVVDATNVYPQDRAKLVAVAREHDVLPVAVVLDVTEQVCRERNAGREDRAFGGDVVARQSKALRRGLKALKREGFRHVHRLGGAAEVDAVTSVERTRLWTDRCDDAGPVDVVGDVHGCLAELEELLSRLGYEVRRDEQGRAVGARHPEGRRLVLLGDLVDRGPDSPGVLRLAMGAHADGDALVVPGNHENKLLRALRGRQVQVSHGLAETLEQLNREPAEFREQVRDWVDGLVSHLVMDDGRLVVCHAGLPERYQNRSSARVRDFALYGQTTGETDEYGLPVRYAWAQEYRGRAVVLYGHTPVPEPEWVNDTLCLDTGCVFGGRLTALRWPERELVSVSAQQVWYEPVKPLGASTSVDGSGTAGDGDGEGGDGQAGRREDDLLDVTDVLGDRVVETSQSGRVKVLAENAAAAFEVSSRFAVGPHRLVYLPPTMAPVATSKADGLLEHPDEAFAYYRSEGVTEVVCEEKHMGSRAVVLLARDADALRRRFGGPDDGARGAVWTRTGRAFFDDDVTAALVDRLRTAAERAGVFDELGSDWVLLDCELLPWSAKAEGLLREQYAPVGAAAGLALPAAVEVLEQAQRAGRDVGDLLERTRQRVDDASAFVDVWRRYTWPVDGVDGVQVAPFAVLAAEGATFHDRPHLWHLEIADRLVDAGPDTLRATRRLVVDTADDASTAAGVDWWQRMVSDGGEGMVVKPAAGVVRGKRGLVQPGLKVRGPEYLRLVYGPEYSRPENLQRLRDRNLGRKRSLAAREYALGLEALERLARGEPLWRVHECVHAVLALESEPVDPRL